MLRRAVPERALGALFGGMPAGEVLVKQLAKTAIAAAKAVSRAGTTATALPALPSMPLPAMRAGLSAAICSDIDQRTGSRQRLNESQQAAHNLCNERFLSTPDISSLDDVVDVLFGAQADNLHFVDVHVQRYAEMLSEIDPTMLIAWQLVRRDTLQNHGMRDTLRERVSRLTTLFVGPRFLPDPFAENHVHIGGVVGDGFVLAQLVLGSEPPSDDSMPEEDGVRLHRIRRILQALVQLWSSSTVANAPVSRAQLYPLLEACRDDAETISKKSTLKWSFVEQGLAGDGNTSGSAGSGASASESDGSQPPNGQWLLRRLAEAASRHDLQSAWIWLFVSLWWTYRSTAKRSDIIRSVVLLFFADVMILRRRMLMDGSGLRRFTSRFFHSPLRKSAASGPGWRAASMMQTAHSLFAHPQDKAELKVIASGLRSGDMASAFARAAHMRIAELSVSALSSAGTATATPTASLPSGTSTAVSHRLAPRASVASTLGNWHLCAHFNRAKDSSRAALWKQARELSLVLQSMTPWSFGSTSESDLVFLAEHLVLPSDLIRGLDVVGDETQWPIERFAPMLRWLRTTGSTSDPAGEIIGSKRREAKLHLSIHAGEDYAHPLSGMRQVDETVEFCEMKAGDSLGHALALGIPPDEWMQRHGEVLLSVDDHVDNLVWAWSRARQMLELQEAQAVLPRLEARIMRMLRHVSWLPSEYLPTEHTLTHLYRAWELRRNCAYKALNAKDQSPISDLELRLGVPDLSVLSPHFLNPGTDSAEGLYVLRARRETRSPTEDPKPLRYVRVAHHRHGHCTRAQQSLEALNPSDHHYVHDHDDATDLRFMMALQDFCVERYALADLSIEANPTSNVYIGQLQTHSDHPIFRWNPPDLSDLQPNQRYNKFSLRSRPMAVTINTDDPGMIPTTLRMEHHMMHEAAIDHGCSDATADSWIEKLRQASVQCFGRRH